MFHVRNIYLDPVRAESGQFELKPTNERAEAICSLFKEFLMNRPAAFTERLGFLKRGDFELDWMAAPGGVALANLSESNETCSMSIMLSGIQPDQDAEMLSVFRENVLDTLLGNTNPPELENATERPLLLQVIFPGAPEWTPVVQILTTSLAAVFFRTVLELNRNNT
jgi:hypothetical protein